MSFQDYKLPPDLVIDMYKSTLVQALTPQGLTAAQSPEISSTIQFKGKNNKSIAVIVACRQKMSETSAEIVFLLKILKACNLGLDDIALIDVKTLGMDMDAFISTFKPAQILLFSENFNGALLPSSQCFDVQTIGDTQMVFAPEVHAMQAEGPESVQLKKKLWLVLKNFFNV